MGNFICGVQETGQYQVILDLPARYRITLRNPQIVKVTGSGDIARVNFGLAPIESVNQNQAVVSPDSTQ